MLAAPATGSLRSLDNQQESKHFLDATDGTLCATMIGATKHMEIVSKRVLVTGAEGFIGSHLVELLVEKGAHVTALSLYNSWNDWAWLDTLSCLTETRGVTGDI